MILPQALKVRPPGNAAPLRQFLRSGHWAQPVLTSGSHKQSQHLNLLGNKGLELPLLPRTRTQVLGVMIMPTD